MVTKKKLQEIRLRNQKMLDDDKYKQMFSHANLNIRPSNKSSSIFNSIQNLDKSWSNGIKPYRSAIGVSPSSTKDNTSLDPEFWHDITGGAYQA